MYMEFNLPKSFFSWKLHGAPKTLQTGKFHSLMSLAKLVAVFFRLNWMHALSAKNKMLTRFLKILANIKPTSESIDLMRHSHIF